MPTTCNFSGGMTSAYQCCNFNRYPAAISLGDKKQGYVLCKCNDVRRNCCRYNLGLGVPSPHVCVL